MILSNISVTHEFTNIKMKREKIRRLLQLQIRALIQTRRFRAARKSIQVARTRYKRQTQKENVQMKNLNPKIHTKKFKRKLKKRILIWIIYKDGEHKLPQVLWPLKGRYQCEIRKKRRTLGEFCTTNYFGQARRRWSPMAIRRGELLGLLDIQCLVTIY